MIIQVCFGILAVGIEIAGIWLSGSFYPSEADIANFLYLHFIACLIAAMVVPGLLPENYRKTTASSFLFIFSITFFIPLIGMTGLAFGLLPALWWQLKSLPLKAWLHSREQILRSSKKYNYGETIGSGQLTGILQHAREENKRLRALISTLSLDNQHALPLLRIALKDEDDNVRLLAYALVKRKENELNDAIRESMSHLGVSTEEERFLHHKSLATNIWELAHLEACSDAAILLCHQACNHAKAALMLQQTDAELLFLLGRILLRVKNYTGAGDALRLSNNYGIDIRKVMPYFAEIAFHERRFTEISYFLETVQFADGHLPLNHLTAYWNRGKHGST